MKTVTFTKSEIENLRDYLFMTNTCTAGCVMGYKNIDCSDTKDDGTYRCGLVRNMHSICTKLGLLEKGAE